jgi:hypothetical protein
LLPRTRARPHHRRASACAVRPLRCAGRSWSTGSASPGRPRIIAGAERAQTPLARPWEAVQCHLGLAVFRVLRNAGWPSWASGSAARGCQAPMSARSPAARTSASSCDGKRWP